MKERSVKDHIEYLHKKTAELISEGLSVREMVEALKKEGIEEQYAKTLINNVLNDDRNQNNSLGLLITGIVIFVGGLAINYYSYQFAENAGGFYIIFWGIVVTGAGMIARALMLWKR